MAKVYGYSDDVVIIEHVEGGSTEIDCYDTDVQITFDDGTIITIGYGKGNMAIWWIIIDHVGTAKFDLAVCNNEDAEVYSDVLTIDAEVVSYKEANYAE